MKIAIMGSMVCWGLILLTMTGCGGMELGGKLGLYAVDQRNEEVKTATFNQPLKCRFWTCPEQGVSRGS